MEKFKKSEQIRNQQKSLIYEMRKEMQNTKETTLSKPSTGTKGSVKNWKNI